MHVDVCDVAVSVIVVVALKVVVIRCKCVVLLLWSWSVLWLSCVFVAVLSLLLCTNVLMFIKSFLWSLPTDLFECQHTCEF